MQPTYYEDAVTYTMQPAIMFPYSVSLRVPF